VKVAEIAPTKVEDLSRTPIKTYMIEAVPTADPLARVRQIHKDIFRDVSKYETVNYVYVLRNKQLVGVISIKELAHAREADQIKDVMKQKLVTVRERTSEKRAVYLALKHSLKALPVVDKKKQFLGVVPSDALLEMLNKVTTREFFTMVGAQHTILSLPLKKQIFSRLPWLLVGLAGGIVVAQLLGGFRELIEKELILAFFMPVIVYMSNAVATQTQMVFIRSLAMGQKVSLVKYLGRELRVGGTLGLISALILAVASLVFQRASLLVALSLGIAMVMAVSAAAMIALFIPWILVRLKKDPAVGSGPFATIIQDTLSLMIYFSIARILLGF
jgi:magnesium transporter